MRLLFGLAALCVVLAVVGYVGSIGLRMMSGGPGAVPAASSPAETASAAGTTPAAGRQLQQQAREAAEQAARQSADRAASADEPR